MSEWTAGDRVYSEVNGYYYGIPGTVTGRSQIQDLSRQEWDYDVRLDTGRCVRINADDLAKVTPEILDAYQRRAEQDAEMNRRAEDRAQRIAEGRRRTAEVQAVRREEIAREERAEYEAEYEAEQTKLREEKGREYGLRSLGITDV